MSSSWHSYPKVWNIGHAALAELFLDEIIIEEKIDGSQFSFGVFDGVVKMRSKGQELVVDAPEKMFQKGAETVFALKDKLVNGWTYRAEYLQKPKHNVLAYDNTPPQNIIIFDINTGEEQYLDRDAKEQEAARLGLAVVPLLFRGAVSSAAGLQELLERDSILGGQRIEGIVVKNYRRFWRDGKALLGKFVSEAFREKHVTDWKESNPGQNDIIERIILQYRTPARWDKAIQHLRDAGALEGSPSDIGKLMKEVPKDVFEECENDIRDELFRWAADSIKRGLNRGLAEHYKQTLLQRAFEQ